MNSVDPLARNNVTIAGNLEAGCTMVFVHGFGTDQTAWKDVAASFAADFRIVLLDNVGAGKSDPAAFVQHHYLNLHAYAADLLEVCAALKLDSAILVGHSLGAMACLLAATKSPSRFSRLVLIGASPRYRNQEGYQGGFAKSDLDQIYHAVSERYQEWAESFAPIAMGNPDRPNLAQYFAETLKAIPSDRTLTVLCSIFQSDHRADLPKLTLPTLLIQSREDVAVPLAVAEYLNQHIKGSRLSVIDAVGHLPHVSAPAEVVAAMREFLGEPVLLQAVC